MANSDEHNLYNVNTKNNFSMADKCWEDGEVCIRSSPSRILEDDTSDDEIQIIMLHKFLFVRMWISITCKQMSFIHSYKQWLDVIYLYLFVDDLRECLLL